MTTASLGARNGGWHRPVAVPSGLGSLQGALSGRVQLPLRVYSSGAGPGRIFDLADEAERIELYEILLTDGDSADIAQYVSGAELERLWPMLWLPGHVRRAWESLLPSTVPGA
jgi:hypothetical protein